MSEAAHRSAPANIAPGAVLAGRYRLDGLLGSGGMAEVWRALDLASNRALAVKLLRPQVAASHEAVQRLKREGEVLSALSHPAIVRVETYGQLEGNIVFLAMELLDGETLGSRMRRGRMEPLELAPIVAGTCAGLAAAHARAIVHRDLKPDNIFLLGGATITSEPQVKLLDFGISKVYGGDRLTYTGEILGTPRYMSPEQLGAEPDVDVRVDVYALGVILYEAIAGKPPFLAATATDLIVAILHGKIAPLRSLRPDVPPALEAVVMRAMARAREARYATATDLADAFLDAAGATAKARALPKPKVMRTQALGGAGSSLPPSASLAGVALGAARGSEGDVLRPGTFSAFEAVDESAVRNAKSLPFDQTALAPSTAPGAPSAAAIATGASAGEVSAGGLRPASAASPHATAPAPHAYGAGPVAPVPTPAPHTGARIEGPARVAAPAPASNPMLARVALVGAGLLAGAVSMAIAIAALHYFGHRAAPPPPPTGAPTPAPTTTPGAPPLSPVGPAEGSGAAPTTREPPSAPPAPIGAAEAPDESIPTGVEPPPASADPSTRRSHRERGREPAAAQAQPTGAPPIDVQQGGAQQGGGGAAAQWPGAADPVEQAMRALAGGHPEECVEILDDVIAHGAVPFTLKRRGDCLLRAGRRDDAIRDYQRFCRIAPDHPAVPSVREQLAGMGLTCP